MSTKFRKTSLLILLLTNLLITGYINLYKGDLEAKASPDTRIYIEPASGTAIVGATYSISLKIDDVLNLQAFDIKLRWGASVLKCTSHTVTVPVETYPNGVLHEIAYPFKNEINETQVPGALTGTMGWFAYVSVGDSFNGSGTILTMDFEVLGEGECDIYFVETDLADAGGTPIPHQIEEGYFYRPGLGEVPVANFTFSPDPAIVNKSVTFDASASYDLDGSIALYMWNFGDGNTTDTPNAVISHNFTEDGFYNVQLTVLDDQGDGSQSRLNHTRVKAVLPNPVAEFIYWPDITVVNKSVTFDASASYDPDPGGSIVEYRWDFGDETRQNTSEPIIKHNYTSLPDPPPYYTVNLTVADLEGLLSDPYWISNVQIVERREIQVTDIAVSPSELTRGENVTITSIIANYGQVDEDYNLTVYCNNTVSQWIQIDAVKGEKLLKQYAPKWRITNSNSSDNHLNKVFKEGSAGPVNSNNTRVKVGDSTGYWTINPGIMNEEDASTVLIDSPIALTTGGWILEEEVGGIKPVSGEFSAGNWSFLIRLYATEHNKINATVLVRVLKSNSTNPQASDAEITVIRDWTEFFKPQKLSNVTKRYEGNIAMPQITLINEHLYMEFQLNVTGNMATPSANVTFQIGVPRKFIGPYAQVQASEFSYKKQYKFNYNTMDLPPGNHVFMVNASEAPRAHEYTNVTNNVKYSSSISITPILLIADFTFTPPTPSLNEPVLFDASDTQVDPFLTATYSWDFGDGTPIIDTTEQTVTHIYTLEGSYNVSLTVTDSWSQVDSASTLITIETKYIPLDVEVDVGDMHFRGEAAEFYILVSRSGRRFNATGIRADLYFNGSLKESFSMINITHIATGLYMIRYEIPIDSSQAPHGTYTLVVDANYIIAGANLNLLGTNFASFILSSTLTGWDATLTRICNDTATIIIPGLNEITADLASINAALVEVQGTTGIINSTLGTLVVELDNINATISDLIHDAKGEIFVQVNTALGSITTKLDNLNSTVTDIKGNTAIIETTLGEVQASIDGAHSFTTIGLTAAAILSAVAAAAAVLAVLILRKHSS